MARTVTRAFFNNLVDVLDTVSINELKSIIGDSTNNHRIPTIRQVIRFLDATGNANLASQLEVSYLQLKSDLAVFRTTVNDRTDGFDINEFLTVFSAVVLEGDTNIRRSFGRVLSAA